MRIAYFTDTYYPQLNGVAVSVGYFVKNLKKKGLRVFLFAPRMKGFRNDHEDTHHLPSMRVSPTLPDSIRFPIPIPHKNFWQIIRRDFDLVHAHGNGVFSFLGFITARSKKVPFIMTFHTQMSQFAHYFLKGKVLTASHINNIFFKRFGNLCDGIVAPSEKMKQELIKSGVKKPIIVIPNFVEFDKFKVKDVQFLRKNYNIPKTYPILLAVGRLGKEKNFEFLLHIFQRITELDNKPYLVIVGEGVDFKKLKKLSEKLGIEKRVRLTGGIPNDKMPYVYKDADIFVFPSVAEVHPMVAIEAAASGLPLIVAKDQAYKGVVVNGKNGYALPLDWEIFTKRIISLLKDTEKMSEFSKNSPLIVKENFNSEKLIRKLLRFYEKILKNYHPSQSDTFASAP